uniref:Uncharacterized protein n=1 Tax=Anguilla anguilla TaxID=7936 RepID=A0A0E9WPV9_ANGAN
MVHLLWWAAEGSRDSRVSPSVYFFPFLCNCTNCGRLSTLFHK